MNKIKLTLLFVITFQVVFSQFENHIWLFGNSTTGIKFDLSTNQPTQFNVQTTPYGREGCGVVTDPITGQLQFYSDGERIYDRNHNVMQNGAGLGGCASSAQAVAMANVPGTCNQYYIFSNTRGSGCSTKELRYSIIDMNLNNNMGSVPLATKNILLRSNIGEGMIVIPKANNAREVWLVGKDNASATYFVYDISTAGINFVNTYILGGCGFNYNINYSAAAGKIAMACPSGYAFTVDFNALTGAMSNYQYIGGSGNVYDCEFSPDGTKLYYAAYNTVNLKQYDFNTGILTQIYSGSTVGGGLGIGPDSKIYFNANQSSNFIARIENPNLAGTACNFVLNGFNMGGPMGGLNLPEVLGSIPIRDIILDFDSTDVSCNGLSDGKIIATATNGQAPYTFDWSINIQADSILNIPAGNYAVTVTDFNGCRNFDSVTVNEPLILTLTVDSAYAVTCVANSDGSIKVNAFGGVPAYTYDWPLGQTLSDSSSGYLPGTYTVSVTDFNACVTNVSYTIYGPQPFLYSLTADSVSCFAGNNGSAEAIAFGGVTPYIYNWSNNQTTAIITNLTAATYTITITDFLGCENIDSIIIGEPPLLTLSVDSAYDVLCAGGSDGKIKVTANGGVQTYTYDWPLGQTLSDSSIGYITGIYTVTVTDANNCTASTGYTIGTPQPLQLSLVDDSITCFGGSDGSIEAFSSGGITPYIYLWSDNQTTAIASNLQADIFTLTVTDKNGCTISNSATTKQPPIITLTSQVIDVSCNAGSDGSIDVTVIDAVNPASYQWSSNDVTEDISLKPEGSYTLVVTDANGCTETITDTINEPDVLSITASAVSTLCFGSSDGSAEVIATGGTQGYAYLWDNNTTASVNANLSVGSYNVTVTDANGCSDSIFNIDVIQPTLMIASLVTDTVTCFGGSDGSAIVSVSGGTGNYNYLWSSSSNSASTELNLSNGNYTLTVTDENGCDSIINFTIDQPRENVINVVHEYEIRLGVTDSVQLDYIANTEPVTFQWTPSEGLLCDDCQEPSFSPVWTTDYTVTMTDADGCVIIDSITVIVDPNPKIYFAPNVFTPNGDNKNDIFEIHAKAVRRFKMDIFNRWGELIYSSTDITKGWDGTFKDRPMHQGVYVYDLYIEYLDLTAHFKTGTVTLVK